MSQKPVQHTIIAGSLFLDGSQGDGAPQLVAEGEPAWLGYNLRSGDLLTIFDEAAEHVVHKVTLDFDGQNYPKGIDRRDWYRALRDGAPATVVPAKYNP